MYLCAAAGSEQVAPLVAQMQTELLNQTYLPEGGAHAKNADQKVGGRKVIWSQMDDPTGSCSLSLDHFQLIKLHPIIYILYIVFNSQIRSVELD